MTLTPADRQRIREAFQARVGNTALPSGATIDDLCRNLVLAIPALLDALDEYDAFLMQSKLTPEEAEHFKYKTEGRFQQLRAELAAANAKIAALADHKDDIQRDRNEIASREDGYRRQIDAQAKIIATLTAQLESDPCP